MERTTASVPPQTVSCLLMLLCLAMLANCSERTVISRSGLTTNVTYGGTTTTATYFNNTFSPFSISKDPNASYIWYGSGASGSCPSAIRATQNIQVMCLTSKTILEISARSSYNFTFHTNSYWTGSGSDPTKSDEYKYENEVYTCGQIFTLVIDAKHTGSSNCATNPANLAFSVSQVVCPCTTPGTYYNMMTCTCALCSTQISGCLTCSSSDAINAVCTSCATGSGWALQAGTCICASGYKMPGCTVCVTNGQCSACDSTLHFQSVGGVCACASGYAMMSGVCVTCANALSNCVACTSNTTCTSCVSTNYAVVAGACVLCSVPLTNCLRCTSSSVCIACTSTASSVVGGHCVSCGVSMPGCLTCSSSTSCTSCDTANHFTPSLGKCACSAGYYLSGSTCNLCSTAIVGCTACTSATVCTTCNTVAHFVAAGTICACTGGYALTGTTCSTCGSLMTGCTACTSLSVCSTCNTALHYQLAGTTCACTTGYTTNAGSCTSCPTLLTNCITCSSNVVCTTCVAGYGPSTATGQCISCTFFDPHCLACTDVSCTSCDSSLNFVESGGLCVCTSPTTVDNGVGVCVLCTTQTGCAQCSSLLYCDVCASGYSLDLANACQPCIAGCNTCSTTSTCDVCDTHFALDTGSICTTCSTFIPGCDTCSSQASCLTCQTANNLMLSALGGPCVCNANSFNNTVACQLCSSVITGCLQCSSGAACTLCDSSLQLVESGGQCVCTAGNAFDGAGLCQICSSFLPECILCSDNSTCTSCTPGYGVDTWTPLSMGTCRLCTILIPNCVGCVDDTACVVCDAGYALTATGGCQPCSSFVAMTDCADCLTNSTCTLCTADATMLDPATGLCEACAFFMTGCLTCSSTSVCLSCDLVNNFDFGGAGCACVSPYIFQTSTSTCQSCATLQPLCQLCDTESTCLVCLLGNYRNATDQCVICPTGCTSCNSATDCIGCDTSQNYVLVGSVCGCSPGYQPAPITGICSAICGDGKAAPTEACDDGNLINGDGCDSTCQIEPNFTCLAFPGQTSICSYSQPLSLNITSITKVPGSNSLSLNFDIGPMLPDLSSLNFSQLINTNLPLLNPRFVMSAAGKLTVTFDYNQTLEGQSLNITVQPAGGSQNFFAVPPTSVVFLLSSTNNTPIAYYNESVYEQQKQFEKAYKGGIGVAYATLAIGLACDKVIGIEMLGVWQVAFLSLSDIDRVQPLLSPLQELGIVNGVNSQFDFNSSAVPNRVAALSYNSDFLANINYMLWVVLADIFVGGMLVLIGQFVPKYKEKVQEVGLRMLKEYLLMLILFNTFNIAYSAGLQFTYGGDTLSLNSVVAGLALLFPLGGALAVTLANPKQFGEFKSHYRANVMCQSYFVWTIAYRTLLGVCMSQLNELEEATIAIFSVGVVFTLYLIANTPYLKGYQNYRAIADQIAILVSLGTAMYYRSMKSTSDVAAVSQILAPAILSLAAMLGATAISVGTLGYELYLKFKPSPDRKIDSSDRLVQESVTLGNIYPCAGDAVLENVLSMD